MLYLIFSIVGLILFFGFFASLIMDKYKIPDPVLLIIGGVLIYVFVLKNYLTLSFNLLEILSNIALIIIMFEAGLNLDFEDIVRNAGKSFFLSIFYFLLSFLLSFFIFSNFLKFNFHNSLILSSMLGGVSSMISIPVVNDIIKDENIKTTIFLETVFSDIFVILITLTLLNFTSINSFGFFGIIKEGLKSISIGFFIGIISGLIWIKVLRAVKNEKYNYMLTLAYLFLIYSFTEFFNGSGAFACLVLGIILANAKEILEFLKVGYKYKLKGVIVYLHEEVTFFIRTFFFISLGMFVGTYLFNLKYFEILLVLSIILVALRIVSLVIFTRNLKASLKAGFVAGRGLSTAVVSIFIYSILKNIDVLTIASLTILLTNIFSIFSIIFKEEKKEVEIKF